MSMVVLSGKRTVQALPQRLSFVFLSVHNAQLILKRHRRRLSHTTLLRVAVPADSYSGYRILYPSYDLRISYEQVTSGIISSSVKYFLFKNIE